MKIVQLPPGGGKTTEMLVWLLEGHAQGISRALVVTTQQKRAALHRRLVELYKDNDQPEYVNKAANRIYSVDALRKAHGRGILDKCEIGIDDADIMLTFFLGLHRPPSIMSVTDATSVAEPLQKSPIF